MQHSLLPSLLLALVVAALPAWAAEVDGFHPPCAAPGDVVYVQGFQFAPRPEVTFGGVQSEVIRTGADVLLCRVPDGLAEGPVELRVDGAAAAAAFQTLAARRPVVHGLSATAGTHGQAVLVHGRRLHAGRVVFISLQDGKAATAEVVGGRRAMVFLVPARLAPGAYDVVLTNGDGLSTGTYSPRFDVVSANDPELCSIHPAGAVPSRPAMSGQPVRCLGTDLGPMGPCRVHWTNRHGLRATSRGHSNGYDVVLAAVPGALKGSESYEVEIALGSDRVTPTATWAPAPSSSALEVTVTPSEGPAGCYVSVHGSNLFGAIDDVHAELTSVHGTVSADVVFRHPGCFGHGAAWVLRIPEGMTKGDYDLTFRIGERVARVVSFRVAEQALAVTDLWPTRPPCACVSLPTLIEGSGFGATKASDELRVVWTDGAHKQESTIVFRSDRVIRVLPLHVYRAGSPPESWSVYVLRGRGADTRVVKAGAARLGSP